MKRNLIVVVKKIAQAVLFILLMLNLLSFNGSGRFERQIYSTSGGSKSVFFQPWKGDIKNEKYNWEIIFYKLKQANIDRLIIQWSQYHDLNFLQKHNNLFKSLIKNAQKYDIKIVFGLYHEANWFNTIEHSPMKKLKDYFARLSDHHIQIAKKIYKRYGQTDLFSGFYIPQEVALYNFKAKNRQDALIQFFKNVSKRLKQNNIETQLYISSFYHQNTNIKQMVGFHERMINQTPVFIFIQDNTGKSAIEISTACNIYNEILDKLPKSRWGIVQEIFVKKDNDHFIPLSTEKSAYNLRQYNQKFSDIPIAFFSLKYLNERYSAFKK